MAVNLEYMLDRLEYQTQCDGDVIGNYYARSARSSLEEKNKNKFIYFWKLLKEWIDNWDETHDYVEPRY